MELYLTALLISPFIMSGAIIVFKKSASFMAFFSAALLSASAIALYFQVPGTLHYSLPSLNVPLLILDALLLLYFAYIGFKERNLKIALLSLVQIALLAFVESIEVNTGFDLVIDRLSLFMFLLINVVGSFILVYAVRYIQDETSDLFSQALFLAILTAFLGVMNLLVSTDNLQWLFLFFEMTTLASFWLIGFRNNDESHANALLALWMNQIGGAALLLAALVAKMEFHTLYLNDLIHGGGEYIILFAAFFSIAALIKGAQVPFSPWLLGAMVAPTPVSAILHSSTMVKIAPYLLLKISPILSGSHLGMVTALIGALSFLLSAALALREESFKKILAYSTISLLGLMVVTASIGTPLAVLACTVLIFFHGISKAVLFLCAGILEKRYHIKSIESVEGMIAKAPRLTSLILLGFLSIALPPFGIFFGKWVLFEGGIGFGTFFSALLLLFIAVGSVALTLLYFKTLGRFVASDDAPQEEEDVFYLFSPLALGTILLILAVFIAPLIGGFFKDTASFITSAAIPISGDLWGITLPFGRLQLWQILWAFVLLGIAPVLASKLRLKGVDKVKPYACGEKIATNAYSFYFDPAHTAERYANAFSILLFILILIIGGFKL